MKCRQLGSVYEPRHLASSLCRDIYTVTQGQAMQWLDVQRLADRLGMSLSEIAPGLEYAITQRWLIAQGKPPSRVALRGLGVTSVRRHMGKIARRSALVTG